LKQNTSQIDFEDTAAAFNSRSTKDLKEALWLFKLLNHKILGGIGKPLLKFAVEVGLPVKGIIKATLYQHFVGGESLKDCLPLVEKMDKQHVESILDYSEEAKETEAEMQHAFDELLTNIKFAGDHKAIPLTVFKTTAIASSALLEKVSRGDALTEKEQKDWEKVQYRVDLLCNTANIVKVPVMIDAEETWIQVAIDQLAHKMMERYNKEGVIVIQTFQMYRKDKLQSLKDCYADAKAKGYQIGAKLVRGAYMEKEREHALKGNYPSPIHDTKQDSDKAYDEAVHFCLEHIDEIFLVVGTHNEESSRKAAEFITTTNHPNNFHHLWFSQLLGMCDQISYTLANHGYNVAKYVPYGPVKAVTPYLIRRADENSSVAGQAKREIALLEHEIKRRSNLK
jgi:proline dehydrogenase